MKKLYFLVTFFLTLFLIFIIGCSNNNQIVAFPEESSSEENSFEENSSEGMETGKPNGEINNPSEDDLPYEPISKKTLRSKKVISYDEKGDVFDYNFNIYNQEGNLIKSSRYNSIGEITDYLINDYDENNNLIKETDYSNNKLFSYSIFTYDDNNNLIKYEHHRTYLSYFVYYTYEYDDKGTLLKESYYDSDSGLVDYRLYEYDERGNRIKDSWFLADGTPDAYFLYEYNKNKSLIKRTCCYANGNIQSYSTFEYDRKGNKIKEISNPDDPNPYYNIYEYNEYGDEVKYYAGNSSVHLRTSSEYLYWEDEHQHDFLGPWKVTNEYHWHECTGCFFENDKSEHSWGEGIITIPASDTNDGVMTFTCTVCSQSRTKSIPSLTHTHEYAETWSYDENFHWHASACGHEDYILDYANHEWDSGSITIEPTEDTEGILIYTCTTCSQTKTESIPNLTHTHEYTETWSYDENYHWHASTCGHENYIDYAVHEWDSGSITTEPTKDTEGIRTYTCTTCSHIKNESVSKLEHIHEYADEWTYDENYHWHMSVCEHKDQISSYAAHEWDSGSITTEPTEDIEGIKTIKCSVCLLSKTESVPKLDKKTWVWTSYSYNYSSSNETFEQTSSSLVDSVNWGYYIDSENYCGEYVIQSESLIKHKTYSQKQVSSCNYVVTPNSIKSNGIYKNYTFDEDENQTSYNETEISQDLLRTFFEDLPVVILKSSIDKNTNTGVEYEKILLEENDNYTLYKIYNITQDKELDYTIYKISHNNILEETYYSNGITYSKTEFIISDNKILKDLGLHNYKSYENDILSSETEYIIKSQSDNRIEIRMQTKENGIITSYTDYIYEQFIIPFDNR